MRLAAEFFCSSPTLADCPRWNRIEVAIGGRSNVGKSSLLNALAGRKNLARISKTPGRTRSLNFFTIEDRLALVDLPGYGYAKMAQTEAAKIGRLMEQYLHTRANLRALIVLIDARRGPQQEDFAIAQLAHCAISRTESRELIVVATKSDKLSRSERGAALERFETGGSTPLMCSALTGEGVEELKRQIMGIRKKERPERSENRQTEEGSRKTSDEQELKKGGPVASAWAPNAPVVDGRKSR